mmetsp:Transcript_24002/g.68310  ORF Transcript_24002/g.68310 Transcript_24002/m.68310 type:complete len:265 (-) Transcript_24002:4-798(-)
MSTGMNLAITPSPTRLALHESGCSMMATLMPMAAARSKVKRFPGRPAPTTTTVAPRAMLLRRFWPSSVACINNFLGTFASIWYVAVGSAPRMRPSRSSADNGFGNVSGLANICSTSKRECAAVGCPAMWRAKSVSNCAATVSLAASSVSSSFITISKSPPSRLTAASPRGTGEAHAAVGEGRNAPELGLRNAMASCNVATCATSENPAGTSGATFSRLPAKPSKQPPQQPVGIAPRRRGRCALRSRASSSSPRRNPAPTSPATR